MDWGEYGQPSTIIPKTRMYARTSMRLVKYRYLASKFRRECSSTEAMAALPCAMSVHCDSICARTCFFVGGLWCLGASNGVFVVIGIGVWGFWNAWS